MGSSQMGDSGGRSARVEGWPFAEVVHGSSVVDDFPVWEPSMKFGRLAIILSSVEVAKLSLPYKTALIFKFFSSHIPSIEVQKALSNWGVRGAVAINIIDRRHLLVKFGMESDFLKIYTREKWIMKGQVLKVFR